MLRTLLTERFRLKVHTETRDVPIYALLSARSGGSLGPRLSRSNVDCDAALAAVAAAQRAGAPPNPADRPVCAFRGFTRSGVTLGQLSAVLTPLLQRVVLDRTGLAGRFDVDLADAWRDAATRCPRTRCLTRRPVDLHHAPGTARSQAGADEGAGRGRRHRHRGTADRELIFVAFVNFCSFVQARQSGNPPRRRTMSQFSKGRRKLSTPAYHEVTKPTKNTKFF